jgi:transcriptional regulator with XRE-family HTH domain
MASLGHTNRYKMTNYELRKIRENSGLTQEKFGKLVGLSGRHIRRLEAGQSVIMPMLEILIRNLEKIKN